MRPNPSPFVRAMKIMVSAFSLGLPLPTSRIMLMEHLRIS